MRLLTLTVLAVALAFSTVSTVARAETEAEKQAELLLEATNMESVLSSTISQTLDLYLQQSPELAPYKNVMLEFFAKYMSYDSLKPELIDTYTEVFTADELKEINAFYQTDVGRKAIAKMPELMAKGSRIGARRVQQNMGELQAMIKAESERLQAAQGEKQE